MKIIRTIVVLTLASLGFSAFAAPTGLAAGTVASKEDCVERLEKQGNSTKLKLRSGKEFAIHLDSLGRPNLINVNGSHFELVYSGETRDVLEMRKLSDGTVTTTPFANLDVEAL